MSEKIWRLIFCGVVGFTLTACEDKAEKRAKLEAQVHAAQIKVEECTWSTHGDMSLYAEKCSDKEKEWKMLKSELDKLNGVKH
ncbi:MAG: hypothetical protein IJR44_07095 [Neisseriaceae bacterium]|nr:hypothetical protein [Neisseriaceae bacterium]